MVSLWELNHYTKMILRGSRCTFLSYVYFQYGTLTQFEVALLSGP